MITVIIYWPDSLISFIVCVFIWVMFCNFDYSITEILQIEIYQSFDNHENVKNCKKLMLRTFWTSILERGTETSRIGVWISTMVTKTFHAAMHVGLVPNVQTKKNCARLPACFAAWINYAAELSGYFLEFVGYTFCFYFLC